jgi:RHS repeat-associated protein
MYWDGTTLINDTHTTSTDSSNTQTASYLTGATRHTRTLTSTNITNPAAGTNYYVTDRHGNTTATTDMNGDTTRAYTYSDYGIATEHVTPGQPGTSANRNAFQYAGEYTTETGNQYLGARTYNPKTTNFTTKDVANQFNLYAYANSNPITLTDPTGQTATWDIVKNGLLAGIGVIAAVFGLAASIITGGTSIPLFIGIVAAGLTDLGIATAQAADTLLEGAGKKGFITDETSAILGWVGLGLGIAAGAAGIADAATNVAKQANAATKNVVDQISTAGTIWPPTGKRGTQQVQTTYTRTLQLLPSTKELLPLLPQDITKKIATMFFSISPKYIKYSIQHYAHDFISQGYKTHVRFGQRRTTLVTNLYENRTTKDLVLNSRIKRRNDQEFLEKSLRFPDGVNPSETIAEELTAADKGISDLYGMVIKDNMYNMSIFFTMFD